MPRSDPFEEFRRARIKEGRDVDRAPQRRECGAHISGIIERVTGTTETTETQTDAVATAAPSAHEVEQLVARLIAEIAHSPSAGRQEQISAFLSVFVDVARRLLSEEGRVTFSRDAEVETDFGGLTAFMPKPDIRALRRERGLP